MLACVSCARKSYHGDNPGIPTTRDESKVSANGPLPQEDPTLRVITISKTWHLGLITNMLVDRGDSFNQSSISQPLAELHGLNIFVFSFDHEIWTSWGADSLRWLPAYEARIFAQIAIGGNADNTRFAHDNPLALLARGFSEGLEVGG